LINTLKKIFQQTSEKSNDPNSDLNLLCGLMVEAANIDGQVDQLEISKISNLLINNFLEEPTSVEVELKKCLNELGNNKSLHSFTSQINKLFSNNKKILLLETLWEIILEDGKLHDFESNLLRRLSGLLYISDVDSGNAKKKALLKLEKINK